MHSQATTKTNNKPAIWLLAACSLMLAFLVDAPIAESVRSTGLEGWIEACVIWDHGIQVALIDVLKVPGEAWFACICVILAGLFHRQAWRAGMFTLICSAASVTNTIPKWMFGRARPFKYHDDTANSLVTPFDCQPFRHGLGGLFEQSNLCFPSGHVTLAFATAAALAILFPRWRWGFYAVASITAVERVIENAHWTSDVVFGVIVAVGGVKILQRVLSARWPVALGFVASSDDQPRQSSPLAEPDSRPVTAS